MANRHVFDHSQLDPREWAGILNGDFFIFRGHLADGWPHESVPTCEHGIAAAAAGGV